MKISVYITSYNQRDFLREAIDSVLAQTLPAHEIIIVDDASSDASPALIRGYAARHPARVRPIFHPQNLGVASARNHALEVVTGDHVTYVDGDDRMLPTKLEREAEALRRHPEAQIAFSNYYNMTVDGQRRGCWIIGERPPEGDIFTRTFARDFPRRDLFRMDLVRMTDLRRVGFYDPSLTAFEDFDLRMRLTKICRACYVDDPLSERRLHGGGLSSIRVEARLALLHQIYRKNVSLLADLDPAAQRYVRRRFFGWMGPFAREAGHKALVDPARSALHRRLAGARYFAFCARHAPHLLTLSDLYRLVLSARAAERWV